MQQIGYSFLLAVAAFCLSIITAPVPLCVVPISTIIVGRTINAYMRKTPLPEVPSVPRTGLAPDGCRLLIYHMVDGYRRVRLLCVSQYTTFGKTHTLTSLYYLLLCYIRNP